jgi:alkaline phosphatase
MARPPVREVALRRLWAGLRLAGAACVVVSLLALGAIQVGVPADRPPRAHSVILFIGDGMGAGQRMAARWFSVGPDGQLGMDALPVQGRARTLSIGGVVTDSAAAATALATGVKTRNGSISMDPNRVSLTTLLELAKADGKAVGLVSTVQLTSATPASFAAHVPSRSETQAIAVQLVDAGIELLLGGGEEDFLPSGSPGACGLAGRRTDGRDLAEAARQGGVTLLCDAQDLAQVESQSASRVLGLFARAEMPQPYAPSLAEMTRVAIEILSRDPSGFFLMIEEGQIDWACHDNDARAAMNLTLELDRAVDVAVEYVESVAGTLLIVTGDHETGGLSVLTGEGGSSHKDGRFQTPTGEAFYVNWDEGGHTAADVPVSAVGPGADLLAGIYENTWVFDVMIQALGLPDPRLAP